MLQTKQKLGIEILSGLAIILRDDTEVYYDLKDAELLPLLSMEFLLQFQTEKKTAWNDAMGKLRILLYSCQQQKNGYIGQSCLVPK